MGDDLVELLGHRRRVGLGEDRPDGGQDHVRRALGDAGQSARPQASQEGRTERAFLAVTDGQTEDLAVACLRDPAALSSTPTASSRPANRQGGGRDWLRGDGFEAGLRQLARKLPLLWDGTVPDGELTAGRSEGSMAALLGSKRHRPDLRFVVSDVPVLDGVDLQRLPWQERRERLELLAQAFDVPLELSPVVDPSASLAEQMADGRLEGIVLKDRTAPYRDGLRAGWTKVKDPSCSRREAWRFERH